MLYEVAQQCGARVEYTVRHIGKTSGDGGGGGGDGGGDDDDDDNDDDDNGINSDMYGDADSAKNYFKSYFKSSFVYVHHDKTTRFVSVGRATKKKDSKSIAATNMLEIMWSIKGMDDAAHAVLMAKLMKTANSTKSPISKLNDHSTKFKLPPPVYSVYPVCLKPLPEFLAICKYNNLETCKSASSKQKSKAEAAKEMMILLERVGGDDFNLKKNT